MVLWGRFQRRFDGFYWIRLDIFPFGNHNRSITAGYILFWAGSDRNGYSRILPKDRSFHFQGGLVFKPDRSGFRGGQLDLGCLGCHRDGAGLLCRFPHQQMCPGLAGASGHQGSGQGLTRLQLLLHKLAAHGGFQLDCFHNPGIHRQQGPGKPEGQILIDPIAIKIENAENVLGLAVTGFSCPQPPPDSRLLSAVNTRGKEIKVPQFPRRGCVTQVRGRQIIVGHLVVIKSRLVS